MRREQWGTRLGLILAMAGNAVGLGNFLRFPVQAAQHGGGAFMIPYFISLLLLGIPLMWVEWTIGRYGGGLGHGTTPAMFDALWKNRVAKYIGILGIFLPLCIAIYYVYIESWTLAYAFFSATGRYFGITSRDQMGVFLSSYQGIATSSHFQGVGTAYLFFLVTLLMNTWVLVKGIQAGIEKLAKFAMPLLFIFAILLVFRVLTLGAPSSLYPERTVFNGLAFLWNPDFQALGDSKVWLAAAGQVFFTLSIGTGAIHTYASYMRKKEDVVLSGLTTAATNELAEVILGGCIAIPVAYAFFGFQETIAIAKGGAFNLGFQAMPIIFQQLPLGQILGMMWFILLFFAAITSSVALLQPAIAFLEDEFGFKRKEAAWVTGGLIFLCAQPVIFAISHGVLDELDYWAGTFGLVLFGFLEMMIFAWFFGMKKGWKELHEGADLRLPKVFYYIIQYVTPIYLAILLLTWGYQEGWSILLMKNIPKEDLFFHFSARMMMLAILAILAMMVRIAWHKRGRVHA